MVNSAIPPAPVRVTVEPAVAPHGPNCPHCQAVKRAQQIRTVALSNGEKLRADNHVHHVGDGHVAHAVDDVKVSPAAKQASVDGSLSEKQQQRVRQLEVRDKEVRAHEAAHRRAGGSLTGVASFQLERGPDGAMYAIAGEVPIDTSEAATPRATIAKAQAIRRAALAPLDPSNADLVVAARAYAMEAKARLLLRQTAEEDDVPITSDLKGGPYDQENQGTVQTLIDEYV